MKKKLGEIFNLKFSFLGLILAYFLIFPTKIFSQDVLPLSVSPAKQELKLNPGENTIVMIDFYNQGDFPVPGVIKKADFLVENNQGKIRFLEEGSLEVSEYSAVNWLTLPANEINLAPKEKTSIPVQINVPNSARPGAKYVSVIFKVLVNQLDREIQNNLAVVPQIASLLYIRVNGETVEKAFISLFKAPFFSEYGPLKIETEITNNSDYHIRPKGIFSLVDINGKTIDQTILLEQNIFPNKSRIYTNYLGKKWLFGRYKISFMASYGERGQALNRSIYVWVFPWKIAVIIIIPLIIAVLLK
ncbi:MAG: hypothetical protein QHH09_00300 [Microgenomates group bacterium]|nr:hypothetical protein [Microgenomates group bacterium]